MAVLNHKAAATMAGGQVSPAVMALAMTIAARLAWAWFNQHQDDPSPIKILFFRVKIRQLRFLMVVLFGESPAQEPAG